MFQSSVDLIHRLQTRRRIEVYGLILGRNSFKQRIQQQLAPASILRKRLPRPSRLQPASIGVLQGICLKTGVNRGSPGGILEERLLARLSKVGCCSVFANRHQNAGGIDSVGRYRFRFSPLRLDAAGRLGCAGVTPGLLGRAEGKEVEEKLLVAPFIAELLLQTFHQEA